MRIWSVHPHHLDRQGLVACWRETLLAQAVLAGRTAGYTRHPQLVRFREHDDPVSLVGAYLHGLADETDARRYRFDRSRILAPRGAGRAGRATLPSPMASSPTSGVTCWLGSGAPRAGRDGGMPRRCRIRCSGTVGPDRRVGAAVRVRTLNAPGRHVLVPDPTRPL